MATVLRFSKRPQSATVMQQTLLPEMQPDPQLIHWLTRLPHWYFQPSFFGTEHLDNSTPKMYIGNHTIYGVIDSPLLIDYLFNERGIVVMSMADHVHFHVPLWQNMIKGFGGVDGTR